MKKNQTSRTAQAMAMFRALESARPAGARLFADPFATHFLIIPMRLAVRAVAKSSAGRGGLAKFIDQRCPGARPIQDSPDGAYRHCAARRAGFRNCAGRYSWRRI